MVRAFVVGCPRSGTTHIQMQLVRADALVSLPETHYFADFVVPGSRRDALRLRTGWPLRRKLPPPKALRGLGIEADRRARSRLWVRSAAAFTEGFDALANQQDAVGWVEKTPSHQNAVPVIRSCVEGAKFIHVIRDGVETVASLVDVSRRYPGGWGGAISVDQAIERWNHSVEIARRWHGSPDYLVVSFEETVADPEVGLRTLMDFLGLEGSPRAPLPGQEATDIVPHNPWKTGNFSENFKLESKAERILGAATSDRVRGSLASLQWLSPARPPAGKEPPSIHQESRSEGA